MLDHAVVNPTPLAIHANFDLRVRQHVDPDATGKLAALIGVEYLWRTVFASASFKASTQSSASMLLDSRQAKTLRLYQYMIATRYRKPRRIGIRHTSSPTPKGSALRGSLQPLDSCPEMGEVLRGRSLRIFHARYLVVISTPVVFNTQFVLCYSTRIYTFSYTP